MGKQLSFSKLERKYSPDFRKNINHSENVNDLKKHFADVVNKFLTDAMEEKDIEITGESLQFNPEEDGHFTVEERLKKNDDFKEVWDNSDLKNAVQRFADTAYNRYLHIKKHNEKTNKKIRN